MLFLFNNMIPIPLYPISQLSLIFEWFSADERAEIWRTRLLGVLPQFKISSSVLRWEESQDRAVKNADGESRHNQRNVAVSG
jgi:hypothetical protein